MAKILIVEDDPKIARFIQLELVHEGYDVLLAGDGRQGLEMVSPDVELVLLDVMLPALNGMEVLRRLRQESSIPVLMLTARDDTMDKVMGLDLGADDYLTKPFAIEELLARIRRILKRQEEKKDQRKTINHRGLSLNEETYEVYYEKERLDLTNKEFLLLAYFMKNINIVLSRSKILEAVWGYDYYGDTNIVDVYVRYLRGKIDEPYQVKFIETVRGAGYRMVEKP